MAVNVVWYVLLHYLHHIITIIRLATVYSFIFFFTQLLTVVPQSNCLCLVYRDAQTLRFTKYITSAARDLGADNSHFHNFACTYYE